MDDSLKPFFVASFRILELGPEYSAIILAIKYTPIIGFRSWIKEFLLSMTQYNPSYDTKHSPIRISILEEIFANLSGYRYRTHSTRNGVLVKLGGS